MCYGANEVFGILDRIVFGPPTNTIVFRGEKARIFPRAYFLKVLSTLIKSKMDLNAIVIIRK